MNGPCSIRAARDVGVDLNINDRCGISGVGEREAEVVTVANALDTDLLVAQDVRRGFPACGPSIVGPASRRAARGSRHQLLKCPTSAMGARSSSVSTSANNRPSGSWNTDRFSLDERFVDDMSGIAVLAKSTAPERQVRRAVRRMTLIVAWPPPMRPGSRSGRRNKREDRTRSAPFVAEIKMIMARLVKIDCLFDEAQSHYARIEIDIAQIYFSRPQ